MSESENNLEQRDDELNKQMAKHPAEESIQVLVKDANRRKRQLHILTGTVIVTLVLALGLTFVSFKLFQITRLAQNNQDAVIQNCETANDSRKNQLALWNYVFSITPEQPRSDSQNQQTEEFRAFVEKTFAPRDCQAKVNK